MSRGSGLATGARELGRLNDGTPYFAPLGQVPYDPDEDRVQCHLCGEWFRVVGSAHLIKRHGWNITQYRAAFGLLKRDVTCAKGVSRNLSRHTHSRHAAGDLKPGTGYPTPPGSPGRPVRPTQSLGALHPDLVAQLHPDLNAGVDPFALGPRSGRKLWWRCTDCEHVWSAAPHERAVGGGCPVCAIGRRQEGNRRVRYERSLAARRPDLAAELHESRNQDLDPATLALFSDQKVWWHCRDCGHDWQTSPENRARGSGCRECAKRALSRLKSHVPRDRSIAVKRPELAAELHPSRNPDLDPFALAAYSNRIVWWLCPACGSEWRAAPYARGKAGHCPACRG